MAQNYDEPFQIAAKFVPNQKIWKAILVACHNHFCPKAQIPSSKCLIWNGFGTGLG
jgi:hypothetical protein